jgi:hypothetical protein
MFVKIKSNQKIESIYRPIYYTIINLKFKACIQLWCINKDIAVSKEDYLMKERIFVQKYQLLRDG